MSALLQELDLEPVEGKVRLSGLVSVKNDTLPPAHIAERVALHEVRLLYRIKERNGHPIDYIFFRRFADGRSPRVAAYVVDNAGETLTREDLAQLHRKVWLNGSAPLLYVEWKSRVDILRCAAGPEFWNQRREVCEYHAADSIEDAAAISRERHLQKVGRFSAFRLATGTFWEDPENADWARGEKASHKTLIDTAIDVDKEIQKNTDAHLLPIMRQMLLLFIFSKYLEDRDVFPKGWFSDFADGADSFKSVLKSGSPAAVQEMLDALRVKFNGDVFNVPRIADKLNPSSLSQFVDFLDARTLKNQRYLWEQYSFRYIPVEVLSHLYQHFAQEGTGAIYTPPFVADLILDQVLPYGEITGKETVLDPTCGSGVFLVGAFRRLVHHWQSENGWGRPGVPFLKKILKTNLFGVEHLESAANVASLNLALAMCDALLPKVIWEHLTFDKLIGRNLFVGDFFEHLEDLRAACPEGFTTIVGNPPFDSKLTTAAVDTRRKELRAIPIPDKQIAYRVTEECAGLLSEQGSLCLLQPSGILYNAKTAAFRSKLFADHTLESVLDFNSIRNLFEAADTKALALCLKKPVPEKGHTIQHLTFRRNKSVSDRIGFELDHYDFHAVTQEQAVCCPWIWKANLLGGGRLVNLTAKIMQWPTLKEFIEEKGWTHGEGFIPGKKSAHKSATWLKGLPLLPLTALTETGVEETKIIKVTDQIFSSPRSKKRFEPPMFLISENGSLNSGLWLKSDLAYEDSIVGINAPETDEKSLVTFSRSFQSFKNELCAFALLKSTKSLVVRSSALLKKDIEELPWPVEELTKSLSWWEQELFQDISKIYAPLIRVGQNAPAYKNGAKRNDFAKYAETFVRLLGSVYGNLKAGRHDVMDGIAYQAFHFGEASDLDWGDDWAAKLKAVLYADANAAFRTARVVRFYEGNTMVILKPDRLRNWIPSTAIRDADETLLDLQEQGF